MNFARFIKSKLNRITPNDIADSYNQDDETEALQLLSKFYKKEDTAAYAPLVSKVASAGCFHTLCVMKEIGFDFTGFIKELPKNTQSSSSDVLNCKSGGSSKEQCINFFAVHGDDLTFNNRNLAVEAVRKKAI